MKIVTRTLHPEGLQKLLLDPLREHPDEPAIKRVEKILTMLVAADAHRTEQLRLLSYETKGIPEFLDNFEKMKESERAYRQTLELLNIKLNRYRWEAIFSGDLDGFRSDFQPAHRRSKWGYTGRGNSFDFTELRGYSEYTESFLAQRDQLLIDEKVLTHEKEPQVGWDLMEPFMIAWLLDAVNQGSISRFRGCLECHQWFYAIRAHQQFCGDSCRRRHEAQSPAFKEKRAQYMRERYRPLQKELEERSKKQSKGVRKTKGRG
jgi:hypothetical protein